MQSTSPSLIQSSPVVPKPRVRPSSFFFFCRCDYLNPRKLFTPSKRLNLPKRRCYIAKKATGNKRGPTHITGINGWWCASAADFHFWPFHGPGKVQVRESEAAEPGLARVLISRDHDLRVGGAGCALDGRWTTHPSYELYRRVCVC